MEEDEGGHHEGAGESEEDLCRQRQPLASHFLHCEVEGEVHRNVGEKEEEEDGGELRLREEQKDHAEQSVDGHEDDQKPKPGKSVKGKASLERKSF